MALHQNCNRGCFLYVFIICKNYHTQFLVFMLLLGSRPVCDISQKANTGNILALWQCFISTSLAHFGLNMPGYLEILFDLLSRIVSDTMHLVDVHM